VSLTDDLQNAPPSLHGQQEFWGLAWEALNFIERTVTPGMATLETGAGASTIVFAASGADHETVTPSQAEADRILAECARRGISTERLTFRIGSSADVLRDWQPRPLDFVLVDGAHAFPYPTLDWWYVHPHVKIGGLMLLDDAYMPPVAAVVEHCRNSAAWQTEPAVSFRTAVVRKLADETIDGEWKGHRMSFAYLPPGKRAVAAVRQRVFSTKAGLKAVELAQPVLRRRRG
jgi:predicted O-methyltransferase YrrM